MLRLGIAAPPTLNQLNKIEKAAELLLAALSEITADKPGTRIKQTDAAPIPVQASVQVPVQAPTSTCAGAICTGIAEERVDAYIDNRNEERTINSRLLDQELAHATRNNRCRWEWNH